MITICVSLPIAILYNNKHIVFWCVLTWFIVHFMAVLKVINLDFIFSMKENNNSLLNQITQKQKEKLEHDVEKAKSYAKFELYYGADVEAINETYQRLVLIVHPDCYINKNDQFKKSIGDAYEVLTKDLQKERMDFDMKKAKAYAILGLQYGADNSEIHKAYRSLISKYHPDHNQDPKAYEQCIIIEDAYKQLNTGVK